MHAIISSAPRAPRPTSRSAQRHLACRLNDRLTAAEENQLEIEVALNAAHHVVADDVAIAEVEERPALGVDHRRSNPAILRGAVVVESAGLV